MISAVTNHLWQSTLFACVIGLLTLLFKSNRAAVRHGLWLAASAKFLMPFSLLIGLGSQMEWQKPSVMNAPRSGTMEQVGEPLAVLASPARSLPQNSSSQIPAILFTVWLVGFAANSLAYGRRWWQVRAASRAASALPLDLPIPALSSSAHLEPGVFGIFRPILLLPAGLREHLSQSEFEAVIAHELCHVRRLDNLTFAIHMLVETSFWFYPPVRWIGTRLIEERERTCDEAVLRMGSDPQDYATGIVTVCSLYLKSPLACVSGVTGSNLRRRVEAIMLNRIAESMNTGKKLLLFAAGAMAVAMPLIVGIIDPSLSQAQKPAKSVPQPVVTSSLPEFEVAAIRPSAPNSDLKVNFASGGKLFITNATLRFLIKIAYDIGDDQLGGGPRWIGTKRFDVAAIPDLPQGGDPANMAPNQLLLFHKPARLRLQRLLADRFQLELRRESTPMPIFALVVANGGPKQLAVTKSSGDLQLNSNAANGDLRATAMDMASLAKFLSEGQAGRPVVDMTELKDKYDFHLEWSPDTNQAALPTGSAANQELVDAGGNSIFSALQQQLGLKLVPRTTAADRLVVVRAELPSPN
jgi:bla regulator protein blaR1